MRPETDRAAVRPLPRASNAAAWRIVDASRLAQDLTLEADVAIVGTGAGGGTAAEILAQAGLSVVMLEEGALKSSTDFNMLESEAYPELYQESAARKTKRQGDQHPAGPLRRRRHDGQLDQLVPDAGRHADALGLAIRHRGLRRRRHGAVVRADGAAARDRAVGRRAQRQQRGPRRGAPRNRDCFGADSPQRARLREPGLLRHGLPGRRQAVDAGDDDPCGAAARRDAGDARAGAEVRAGARPRGAARGASRWTPPACTPTARRITVRARDLRVGGRRDRHAGAAAARRACRIPTASSAGAPSSIRRWSAPR